jgi:glutathione reductase (NADPH)
LNRLPAGEAYGSTPGENNMTTQYDLAIIGSGTAAMTAAMAVRAAGWKVAVTDFRPFGGTCVLRGCDPKKMLVSGTAALDYAQRMRNNGVVGNVRIEWPELMAFKRAFTDPMPEKMEQTYIEKGIDTYHGRVRFIGKNSLRVEGDVLEAKHILLASGAEPIKLNIPGEEHLITNEEFLALETLPRRIVLVGGGYIAAEFSHIAARAGASVTVFQRGERMLKKFDPEVVGWLMESFKTLGIDLRTRTLVEAIEKINGGYAVRARAAGNSVRVEADLVVHAAGRAPAFEPLDLEAAGVATEKGRLKLNEYLQSVSNPAVYAAGDAAQMGPPLTPVASYDAEVVAANLLNGNHRKPDYAGVPSVAFTIPSIAAVGISEAEGAKKGIKFKIRSQKATDWFTARQAAESVYGFKILVDEESNLVLGAHLVGPHVEEVINIFALAIRHGLTVNDLKATIFAYPTGASDIGSML